MYSLKLFCVVLMIHFKNGMLYIFLPFEKKKKDIDKENTIRLFFSMFPLVLFSACQYLSVIVIRKIIANIFTSLTT